MTEIEIYNLRKNDNLEIIKLIKTKTESEVFIMLKNNDFEVEVDAIVEDYPIDKYEKYIKFPMIYSDVKNKKDLIDIYLDNNTILENWFEFTPDYIRQQRTLKLKKLSK